MTDNTPKRELPPLVARNRERLLAIAEYHGLCNVRLFGSMARGDANANSDVDLLVDAKPGTSGLALGGMLVDTEELLGRPVDVVTEGFLAPSIRDDVLREALPL